MSNRNLRSLNWEDLLHNSSNDEYDSDETLCEEVVGIDTKIKEAPHYGQNSKTAHKSHVEYQTVLKNVEIRPGMISDKTLMSNEGYNSNNVHSCFSMKIEENLNKSDRNGFSEPLRLSLGGVDNNNKPNDASESSFGFSNMTLDCTEQIPSDSIKKTEVEQRPEKEEHFYDDSSRKERGFITRPHVMKESDRVEQLLGWHGPIGVTSGNVELQTSSTTVNNGQYNNNEMFNDVSNEFKQARDSPSNTDNIDKLREFSYDKKAKMNLDLVDNEFYFTGILDTDNEAFNNEITDFFDYSCNETQLDTDGCSLKSENCFLGISTESLENILGGDFIEETVEHTNVSRRNTCSPPLTLIEKSNQKRIMSTKILSQKKRSNKRDISEKLLPARTCSSRYINQSKRTILSEEPSESKSGSFSAKNAKGIESTVRKPTKKVSYQKNKISAHSEVKALGKPIKRNTKKNDKAFPGKKSSQAEKSVKVPFIQNLKEMEQALRQIEENTYKWVNGDEENFVSREKAFKMLMETQSIVKILESLQVPLRINAKIMEMKNKLCERAKKLALAIDAAIAECDQMFRQECYDKLFDEKSIKGDEEKAERIVGQDQNMAKHPKSVILNDSTESSFDHNIYENSSKSNTIIHQGSMEIKKPNVQYTDNDDSGRSVFTWRHTPKINQWKSSLSQINKQTIKHIPKPILKYSSSESPTETGGSNGKHISFSNDVEFCYLSGSSGQASSHSQASFETDRKFTKSNVTGNITNDLLQYPNSNVIFDKNALRDNAFTSNESQNKETCVQFKSISSELQEKCNGESTSEQFYVKKSVVVGDVMSEKPGLSNSLKLLRISDWTQLKQLSNHDVDMRNSAEELVEIGYPTTSYNSQSSSEGFGFSEDILNTSQRTWGEVSITDIRYLRIKSPAEFTPAEEDIDTWLDLDKW